MAQQKALRVLTGAALLTVSAAVAINAVTTADWQARMQDTENQLAYSRQRERKQQVELARVQESLPMLRSDLAELLPMQETAAAEEASLREQRKEARARDQSLSEAIEENQRIAEEARAELIRAISEQNSLLNQAGSLWFSATHPAANGNGQELTASASEAHHGQ